MNSNIPRWLLVLATCISPSQVRALEWEIEAPPPSAAASLPHVSLEPHLNRPRSVNGPVWSPDVDPIHPDASTRLAWEAVPLGEEITTTTTTEAPANKSPSIAAVSAPPSGPTYANFRALWRDGDWLPQISNTVPIGFGPQGLMASFNYRAIDCITGAGLCTVPANYDAWQQSIQSQGDAFFDLSIGFGDSVKAVGVIVTDTAEGTALNGPRSKNGFLTDNNLGFHLSKGFGPDTAVRVGVNNLLREDCDNGQCGLPQSAYGVISQRLRFNPNPNAWFANAYLTAGAGNGSFRDLGDQIQASYLAQHNAGCSTYGYQPKKECSAATRRRAVVDAYDYGKLFPIGSLGIEVVRGFHLITEWSGRNLNAGLSFRPFPELGLVITPMFENLVPNCDYGCRVHVPDYPSGAPLPANVLTERPRFSIQASVEVKF